MPSPSYDVEENLPSRTDDIPVTRKPIVKTPKVYRMTTLQKTGCFGKCPDYEFILMSNGEATYIGNENTKRIGKYKTNIGAGFLFDMKARVQSEEFYKMSTMYPTNGNIIKELPDAYLLLNDGSRQIIIRNNHDAPKELLDFEKYLEGLIEQLNWVKQ